MDKISDVRSSFTSLGLQENKEFLVIGKNETGKKCIEGLVPYNLLSKVYSENVDLVQKAMENSNNGKNARNELKGKILELFKTEAENDLNNFSEFYKLSKIINKTFK